MNATLPLIIIGSGLAGYMLAKEWRKLDTQTPLIIVTEDDGGFYSKPLLSTALAQQKNPTALVIADSQSMANELNAQILTDSTVNTIDPFLNTITVNNELILNFSRLVIACGAKPIKPLLDGDAVDAIKSVNNLREYAHFRDWLQDKKHIVLLGAGLVGCEFANDLALAGYEVSIVMPESYPLANFLPVVIGKLLKEALEAQGITWYSGDLAVTASHEDKKHSVTLANGKKLLADGVFSAVGLRSATGLAKQSSILVNRGIIVNRWLQTNFPHIFALGDCAEVDGAVNLYVAPLLQCARALAKILAGGADPVHYPAMSVVVKTPCFPLVFSTPPENVIGQWQFEGEGSDLRALFHDENGQLRGFALVGNKIRDKMPLAKQLPLVFSE